jgi:hypothetical protein
MSRILNRRHALGAAAAMCAGFEGLPVAMADTSPAAGGAAALDPLLTYRKMHFRSDDGLVFWWLQGIKYGQVDATLTPLYNSSIGTLQRIKYRPDGGFDVTQLEMNVMLDLATGEPLESWRNPYTNEVLPVRLSPVGPTVTRYGADNVRVLPKEIGGTPLEATATVHPPSIVADDVFQRDESVARVFTPGRAKPFEVNDIAMYHGSVADLKNPKTTVGAATVFFAEVTGWQRWMNMGDRPGGLTSRMFGRKVRRYEDLPAQWRANLARVAPKIAADPIAALDAPAARFER